MSTCARDIDEKTKRLLPKEMLDKYAKQRKRINKKYRVGSEEHTTKANELTQIYETRALKLTDEDLNNSLKEKLAGDRFQKAVQEKASLTGKKLTISELEDIVLSFSEGSVTSVFEGARDSSDAHYKAVKAELDTYLHNLIAEHDLKKYMEPDDTLKVFQIKEKMNLEKTKVTLKDLDKLDPHTKGATILRFLEVVKMKAYKNMGYNPGYQKNFIAHHMHNVAKITTAKFDKWFADIQPLLDKTKPLTDMFEKPSMDELRTEFQEIYRRMEENDFSDFDGMVRIQFADAESFLKYDKDYGSGGDNWMQMAGHSNERAARRLGIIQNYGNRPDHVFKLIKSMAHKIDSDFRTVEGNVDESYKALRGSLYVHKGTPYKVGSLAVQAAGSGLMNISGAVAFAGDMIGRFTGAKTLLGKSYVNSLKLSMGGWNLMAKSIFNRAEMKKLGRANGVEMHDRYKLTSGAYSNETYGPKLGKVHKAISTVSEFNGFLNGLESLTTGGKIYVNDVLTSELEVDFKGNWDQLNRNKQIHYGSFWSKEDFNNMAKILKDKKINYMDLKELLDRSEELTLPKEWHLGEDTKKEMITNKKGEIVRPRENFMKKRQRAYATDLRSKIMKYLQDTNNQNVAVPSLKEFRLLGGAKNYSNQYSALAGKFFRQFKMTPFKMFHDTIYQAQVENKVAGNSHEWIYTAGVKTALGMTVVALTGYITKQAHDLVFEEEEEREMDTTEYMIKLFARAGSMGIAGDILATGLNPRGVLGSLAGPLNNELWNIGQDIGEGVLRMTETGDIVDPLGQVGAKVSKRLLHTFLPAPAIGKALYKKGIEDYLKNYSAEIDRQYTRGVQRGRSR